MLPADLRSELRWLAGGFLLTLSSGFGQTYFIALFAGELKGSLDITDGQFGSLYTVATLASAALLTWAGKLADRFSARALGVGVLAAFALTSLGMASVESVWMLGVVLFGLRFFGQGMLTHVAMTAMGRWFNRKRGRAVSITALGFPAGEAVLPLVAVALTAVVGWRGAWVAASGAVLLISIPVLTVLLRRERRPTPSGSAGARGDTARRDWTRGEVLRSPVFYALLPGVLATPLVVTGLFFNQVTIAATKGWPLSWFAATFPVLAALHVSSALAAGWMVDRFGARRLLPLLLLPLGLATLTVTYATSPSMLVVFMALVGLSQGGASTMQGALWPELFGITHLGAIRSIVMAGVVFASALAPGGIGVLLDAGVSIEAQFLAMAVYCFVVAIWMAVLLPRLNRLAAG
jgi:MFS family permease